MRISLHNGDYLDVDREKLARELQAEADAEVRFDDGSRALYATDASNYRQVPVGVVVPRSRDAAAAALAVCRRHGVPVTSRGGGTSLAGQCCNVAVIMDLSKYLRRIVELDPQQQQARVEPGVVIDQLRTAAGRHGLTFGCDTSTHAYATLGGSIGNNACGVHSVQCGRTADNVEALEVVTYDGTRLRVGATDDRTYRSLIAGDGRAADIHRRLRALRDRHGDEIRRRFPRIPRRVSGYNLDDLLPEKGFQVARSLVGSEGTCALTLEATVRLIPDPPHRVLLIVGYPDIYTAADRVPDLMACGPIALEAIDEILVSNVKTKQLDVQDLSVLPEGRAFLLVEFGGATPEAAADAAGKAVGAAGAVAHVVHRDAAAQASAWAVREDGLPATARVPGLDDTWEGWEDSAVAPERLGGYLRALRALYDDFGYNGAFYGHFGQGCVHTRINFDLKCAEGVRKYRAFINAATSLVVEHGGVFSGEHGDGQSKAEFLGKIYGEELVGAFADFKRIWDPDGRMNPGKVVDPYAIDTNLRFGRNYAPPQQATHFHFADDRDSFAYATERCVGVGKCRRADTGTMCPSYMVTLEEEHSTRGRARLLFEMLQGDPIGRDGWRDEHVKDALDLCLACKACRGECPMEVDMAAYKAEFLSHYHETKARPRSAFAMGRIATWARAAQLAPGLVNLAARVPVLEDAAKWVAGIAPQRQLPRFARRTFRQWFERRRAPAYGERAPVLLWADTFTNHFHPGQGIAATEVLERLGWSVKLPRSGLCCGRPLYDYGWLDRARAQLAEILEALRPQIRAGLPMVALEPSCLSVFRDELRNFFPNDEDAGRLRAQSFTLAEFLERHAGEQPLPRLDRPAMVHVHCHQRGVIGLQAEQRLFERLGLDAEVLDSGCCGMAGAFGFEREHFDVSVKCGERVLLPRVRSAPEDTVVLADGFSCREQIRQTTSRRAQHLAELIRTGWSG